MTYFSRNNRVGKKVRKNLSFLLVFLIFALLTISVGNIRSINHVKVIDKQSQILSSDTELIWEKTWGGNGTYIAYATWGSDEYSTGLSIWGDNSNIYICGSVDYYNDDLNELLFIKFNHFSLSSPVLSNINPNLDLEGNITINWNEVVGTTSYNVYRDSSIIIDLMDLVPIGNSTSTSYSDYGLSNGTYYYVIVATRGSLYSPISNCEAILVAITPGTEETEGGIPGYPIELFISFLGILMASLSIKRYRELS